MQSHLKGNEDHITSTHTHKLEASFHSRTTGNLTTGEVKRTAPHSSYEKVYSTSGSYCRSRASRRKRMTKGHPNKKAGTAAFFLDKLEHFERETAQTHEQKSARRNMEECRIQSIFSSYLEIGLLSLSNPLG